MEDKFIKRFNWKEIWSSDKTFSRKCLETYWYWELCWGQAHAFIQEPKTLFTDFLILSLFLSNKGFNDDKLIVIVFIVIGVLALMFGNYTIKKKWLHWHSSFSNQFNPEIIKILKNTEKDKKNG